VNQSKNVILKEFCIAVTVRERLMQPTRLKHTQADACLPSSKWHIHKCV